MAIDFDDAVSTVNRMRQRLGGGGAARPDYGVADRLGLNVRGGDGAAMPRAKHHAPHAPHVPHKAESLKEVVHDTLKNAPDPGQVADVINPHEKVQAVPEEPTTLERADKVAEKVSTYSGYAAMGPFIAVSGAGAVAAGLSGAGGFLEKRNIIGGKALGKAGTTLKRPVEYVNNKTIGELGIVGRLIGGVSKAASSVAGVMADGLHAIGVTDWRANAFERKAAAHWDKARELHSGLGATQIAHPEMQQAVVEKLGAALSAPVHAASQEEFQAVLKHANDMASKHQTALAAPLAKIEKAAGKAHDAHYIQDGWRNLRTHARNAHQRIAQGGVVNSLTNASIVAGLGASTYFTARGVKSSVEGLKDIYADMTGTKPESISTFSLLLGGAPPAFKEARKQVLREFGPASVLEAANWVVNANFILRNKFAILPMILLGGGSQLLRTATAGTLVPAYQAIKQAQAHHVKAPAELYAQVLGDAIPELKERGGVNSRFTKALAEHYAAQQVSATQLMKDIGSGKAMAVLEELKRAPKPEAQAQTQQVKAEAVAPPQPVVEAPKRSHVEALAQGPIVPSTLTVRPELAREAVGKFTEKWKAGMLQNGVAAEFGPGTA